MRACAKFKIDVKKSEQYIQYRSLLQTDVQTFQQAG